MTSKVAEEARTIRKRIVRRADNFIIINNSHEFEFAFDVINLLAITVKL